MNKKKLAEVKSKLEVMKASTEMNIANVEASAKSLEEGAGDLDSFDQSTNNSEMNRLKNLKSQNDRYLMQIKAAMIRVDSGKFGTCLTCGEPIPENRLMINPLSFRCLECQEDLEVNQKRLKVGGRAEISTDDGDED